MKNLRLSGGIALEKKIVANIYHHTHWDNEWYFTEEDSLIQFSYHMKELLAAFENKIIDYFYLDGQTAIIEDYINLHPENRQKITDLVSQKKLFIGPFNTQIDSFITSGESAINNLRYGINYANNLGGASLIAYLPDSFGQSQDYPKIFNQLGINSFVFRRGLGDEHNLPLDFIYRSNDGSEVVVNTLYCGYGFATEPFVNGTLIGDAGLDYDGKDINAQLEKLVELSTLENEFLLPIGNDQTPVIWNFKERLSEYQTANSKFEFKEVTLAEYMDKVTQNKENLKTYQGELINPQYHRVHRSIYSARMDIKIVQDKVERMMALEIQPMMAILAELGFEYDDQLISRIWNLLGRSQTHSAATNTDKTNNLILSRSERALNLAEALRTYLIRKISISNIKDQSSITFFNTLPATRDMLLEFEIYTSSPEFILKYQGDVVGYQRIKQEKEYGGNARIDQRNYSEELFFYRTTVVLEIDAVEGFSYQTIYIEEGSNLVLPMTTEKTSVNTIENEHYRIWHDNEGLHLATKEDEEVIRNFIYLEESGDEGDNYDYSYPKYDLTVKDYLTDVAHEVTFGVNQSEIILTGKMKCPEDLSARKEGEINTENPFEIRLKLVRKSKVVDISGTFSNKSLNHRVRLVSKTNSTNRTAAAGTQFGVINRKKEDNLLTKWEEEGWLEEPSPIYPLLNFVSIEEDTKKYIVYTKSSKEYELLENKTSEIAITLFRSVGYLGLPDLNRRPGRASGLAEKLIPSPQSQMIMDNEFHIGISILNDRNYNDVINEYNKFSVETITYQKQHLNRVVTPISYFETNPLPNAIPDNYQLKSEEQELAFSTLEKFDGKTLVRYFNNSQQDQQLTEGVKKVDLLGNSLPTSSIAVVGEIVNCELI